MRGFTSIWILALVIISVAHDPIYSRASDQPSHRRAAALQRNVANRRDVILATQRNNRLHVFDAETLEPLGYFVTGNGAHSVSARPDGRTLFLEQVMPSDSNGCCALFALNLETKQLCHLVEPSGLAVVTPNNQRLFTQRGNVGIEVFDAQTLARLPTIDAPGVYDLRPSPSNRWLFGATNWSGPSLDIFSISHGKMLRRLPIPEGMLGRGEWIGEQFYLYAYDGRQGYIWRVNPQTTALSSPVSVLLPDLRSSGKSVWQNVLAAGDRLIVYESFGTKLDRRRDESRGRGVPGGAFMIEPKAGKVIKHLAPSIYFHRLIANHDGQKLYGIDSVAPDVHGPVRLLKIDANSGEVLVERALEDDVWFISFASIPEAYVPDGEVRPAQCAADGKGNHLTVR